ncbi:MAG: recombination protein O N-terminal domain-containing protein [Parcubacteria group bacterium]|nr:recombination protein O N-terminal domain-containing protein [Parcubacteria group bacterium]
MYRIYSTEGLILGSFATGEASKILSLFTKDFGLLSARAQGVRKGHSKLKCHLQDFSLASFDLVRGKNGWRVTSAQDALHLVPFPVGSRETGNRPQDVVVRVSSLLTRLLRGEEKDAELYLDVVSSFRALQNAAVENTSVKDFEALLLMRILHRLGYWGDDALLSPFLRSFEIEKPETFASFAPVRRHAIRRINAALKETQL